MEKSLQPIKNEFDTPRRPMLDHPPTTMSIDLAFLESEDLKEIEEGVREVMQHVGYSIIAIGLAFYRIEKDALFVQAGKTGYIEYLVDAEDRVGLPVSTISDYKRIGEAYAKWRSDLEKVKFDERQGVHKLRHIDAAVKIHPKGEVFKKLVKLSYKEFTAWARGRFDDKADEPKVSIEVRKNQILVDGKNILNVPADLPDSERDKLVQRLERIYKIEAAGNEPFIVETYGSGEQRAIDNFLKKFRAEK